MSQNDNNRDEQIWASTAPEYKKHGEMYCSVEYDHNGEPRRIRVAQNQIRRGEFEVEGQTAVYIPHNVSTLSDPTEQVISLVESLPFVSRVDMGGVDDD